MECSCTQVSTVQLGLSIHHVFGCGCVLVWVSGPCRLICATRAGEVLSSPLWKEWKERREEQRQTERKIWGGEGYKKRRNERVGRAVCMREAKSLWGGMWESSLCWVEPFLQKFWLVSTEHVNLWACSSYHSVSNTFSSFSRSIFHPSLRIIESSSESNPSTLITLLAERNKQIFFYFDRFWYTSFLLNQSLYSCTEDVEWHAVKYSTYL